MEARLSRRVVAPVLLCLLGTLASVHHAAALQPLTLDCDTASPAASLPPSPGPVRFGINPRVQAGQIGPEQPAVPADTAKQLLALGTLSGGSPTRAGARPFVLRLNRIFFPERPGQAAALAQDVATYGAAGYLLEFQLRFHPPDLAPGVPDKTGGDPAAFAAWAADLVHQYDANPALVSVQVGNEANVDYSFDSSDGFYTQSIAAMTQGVLAVKNRVTADQQAHVRIGTNWVYRGLPTTDKTFWDSFRSNAPARAALDWVGLDAYPGTFPFPSQPASYYNALAADLDLMRQCFMAYAGISKTVPIYIEETGWPTLDPLRPATTQQAVLKQLSSAARDYAQTYNLTDFRWFNLRDADSSSQNLQQHFGMMTSAYAAKPAFCTYRTVVTGALDCPGFATAADPFAAPAVPPPQGPSPASRALPGTSASPPVRDRLPAILLGALAVILLVATSRRWAWS